MTKRLTLSIMWLMLIITVFLGAGIIMGKHSFNADAAAVGNAAGFKRVEAEDSVVNLGSVNKDSNCNFSGSGLIRSLGVKQPYQYTVNNLYAVSHVTFKFSVNSAEESKLVVGYSSDTDNTYIAVIVNGEANKVKLNKGNAWNTAMRTDEVDVKLAQGINEITVTAPITDYNSNGWADIDYIDIKTNQTVTNSAEINGEQAKTVINSEITRFEPSYYGFKSDIKSDGGDYRATLPMSSNIVGNNSKLAFEVDSVSAKSVNMKVNYVVERYNKVFPQHKVSVYSGSVSGSAASEFTLFYDKCQIRKSHSIDVEVQLYAGKNYIVFENAFIAAEMAVITVDNIEVGGAFDAPYIERVFNSSSASAPIINKTDSAVFGSNGIYKSKADDNSGTIVLQADKDISSFKFVFSVKHQDYFGKVSVSNDADGTYTNINYIKSPRLTAKGDSYRRTVVRNEAAIPSGMRFIKIELPPIYTEESLKVFADTSSIVLNEASLWCGEKTDILLSSPVSRQIVQRVGNAADVEVTGVLKSSLDAYITVTDKSGAAVTGFSNIKADKAADKSFSVTLRGLSQGLYDIKAEAKSGADGAAQSEATAESFGVGDVWLIAGQSNSTGNAKRAGSEGALIEQPEDGISVFYPDTQEWILAEQPIGENKGQPDYSSFGLTFAKEIKAKAGVPVGLINTGVGGTSISRWSLAKSGFLYRYNLRSCFIKNDSSVTGVLWNQGSTDCNLEYTSPISDNTAITKPLHNNSCTVYEYYLSDLIQNLRSDFNNSSLPFLISQISYQGSGSQENNYWAAIREAHRRVGSSTSPHRIANVYTFSTTDSILWDNWLHNSMGSNQTIARRYANIALNKVYGFEDVRDVLFPDIFKAHLFSSRKIVLEFSNVEHGFTASGDFKGEFSVTDGGGINIEISSAEIIGANNDKILLTLKSNAATSSKVSGLSKSNLNPIILKTADTSYPVISFASFNVTNASAADTESLSSVVAAAAAIKSTDYTPESYGNLKTVLDSVISKMTDEYLLKSDADYLENLLTEALGGLTKKAITPAVPPQDEGLSAIAITFIIIGCVAVAAAGGTTIILLVRKKKKAKV